MLKRECELELEQNVLQADAPVLSYCDYCWRFTERKPKVYTLNPSCMFDITTVPATSTCKRPLMLGSLSMAWWNNGCPPWKLWGSKTKVTSISDSISSAIDIVSLSWSPSTPDPKVVDLLHSLRCLVIWNGHWRPMKNSWRIWQKLVRSWNRKADCGWKKPFNSRHSFKCLKLAPYGCSRFPTCRPMTVLRCLK